MNIPAKFIKRVGDNLKNYQSIINGLKVREDNEANTVDVISGILSDIFGYAKYTEITREHQKNGAFCDLAIKGAGDSIHILIEAKAIKVQLTENHTRQAITYGAERGVKWIILTNSENWIIYKIKPGLPIDKEVVFEFNLLNISVKNDKDMEMLFALSKEGQGKSVMDELYSQQQIKNKYTITALLVSDFADIYGSIKRTMRKLFPDVAISTEEIECFIKNEILKGEILKSAEGELAQKEIIKAIKKLEKQKIKVLPGAEKKLQNDINL